MVKKILIIGILFSNIFAEKVTLRNGRKVESTRVVEVMKNLRSLELLELRELFRIYNSLSYSIEHLFGPDRATFTGKGLWPKDLVLEAIIESAIRYNRSRNACELINPLLGSQ